MSYELLQFFKTLFETRSLTYTSGQLGISQAGASRMLLKLRETFGEALFIRTRYGMVPTARAEAMFPRVLAMLSEMEQMMAPDSGVMPGGLRTLHIGIADNALFTIFPSFLKKISEKAMQEQIELHPLSPDIFQQMESGRLDAAICPREPLPTDFHKLDLLEEHYVCLVHEQHPLARYAKTDKVPPLNILNDYRRIVITPYGSRQGPIVDGTELRNQLDSPVSLWMPYFLGAPWLLDKTGPFVLLPARTAAVFCRLLPLVTFPCPVKVRKFSIRLIWHHRMHHEPALKWLKASLLESVQTLRQGPDWRPAPHKAAKKVKMAKATAV